MANTRSEIQPVQAQFQMGHLQNRVLFCYSYVIDPD
jgi:hypothetical protein